MKTFLIKIGADDPQQMNTSEEVRVYLIALLTEHGWDAGMAESTARITAQRLDKGGRFAPDDRVTDVRPDGDWLRAWWVEAA